MSGNIPNGVQNPEEVSFVAGSGASLDYDDLTAAELAVLTRDLRRLASGTTSLQREIGNLYMEDLDTYIWAAAIAKKQLAVPFRGLLANSSGQFGFQPIRSAYILSGNPQTWIKNQSSTGWSASAFDVNLATSSGNLPNTQNRVILCAPRLANYAVTPKVNGIRFTVGPTTYPVQVLDWYKTTNLYIAKNIGALLVSKNGTFTADQLVEFTGQDGTALFGLAFGTGDWLTYET